MTTLAGVVQTAVSVPIVDADIASPGAPNTWFRKFSFIGSLQDLQFSLFQLITLSVTTETTAIDLLSPMRHPEICETIGVEAKGI